MTPSSHLFAFSLFLSIALFSSVTKASEQVLATIKTDVNSDNFQLIVDINDGDRILRAFYIDNYSEGKKTKRDELLLDTFLDSGINLPQNSKVSFAKINGNNFDLSLGGQIVIDTLYNIITGKRKSYELDLAQDLSGWKLFYRGKIITQITAHANKIPVIGIVGAHNLSMK